MQILSILFLLVQCFSAHYYVDGIKNIKVKTKCYRGLKSMKKKHIVVIIVCCLCFGLLYYIGQGNKRELPTLSVCCYEKSISEDSAVVVFEVENMSEQVVTFNENNFAKITLNGNEVAYPTKYISLQPGETKQIEIELTKVIPNKQNEVKVTTTCNQGTSATYVLTLEL